MCVTPRALMPEPTIVLDRLAKFFGDVAAVEGLSLTVPAGEIFGFPGANGAGKTTTIRMLCGLIKPTSGHGRIFGRDLWQERHGSRTVSWFSFASALPGGVLVMLQAYLFPRIVL